ncbi:MAG: hypothetical protein ACRDIB_09165 [Ardenticatenaceae bacterium]
MASFYPLVAALVGSESLMVGRSLHYLIGAIIGITFGLLFHRDIRGLGMGLVWGMSYGLFWWVLGPMTLLPWLLSGEQPNWTITAAQGAVPALVAHMLYGAMVGFFFAIGNKLWQVLFVDSDPLNRTLEGAGARGLRGILMGEAAGIIGGLLFTFVMVGIGALPRVASLVGAESPLAGLVVHLIISVIIGSTYGLLFRREVYSYGSGLAWGLAYGLLWWLLGALTLFAVLLRQPVNWSREAVAALYPSLIGHLLYGAGLGLFFHFLALRYDIELRRLRYGVVRQESITQRTPVTARRALDSPAPALWAVALALGVILPLLLSGGTSPADATPPGDYPMPQSPTEESPPQDDPYDFGY